MADKGGKPFTSRLWELAILAIVVSFASQLVMLYVVPLIPYIVGTAVIGAAIYLVISYRRRW